MPAVTVKSHGQVWLHTNLRLNLTWQCNYIVLTPPAEFSSVLTWFWHQIHIQTSMPFSWGCSTFFNKSLAVRKDPYPFIHPSRLNQLLYGRRFVCTSQSGFTVKTMEQIAWSDYLIFGELMWVNTCSSLVNVRQDYIHTWSVSSWTRFLDWLSFTIRPRQRQFKYEIIEKLR